MTAAKTFSTIFHSSPIHYYCILKKSHNHLDLHAHIHINLRGVCFIFLSLSISLFLSLSLSLSLCEYICISFSLSRVDGRWKRDTTSNSFHFTSPNLYFTFSHRICSSTCTTPEASHMFLEVIKAHFILLR